MQKITAFISMCVFIIGSVNAQVGIGTETPDPSAMLDVSSTTKGLLIPRLALTATNDVAPIANPLQSLLVYNTATNGTDRIAVFPGYYYWNGIGWTSLTTYTLQQNINTNGKYISGDGTNTGISVFDNGTIVSSGEFGTGGALTAQGQGTRLIWYPKKAAFRAGSVNGDQWDDVNIGDKSVALGSGNTASGLNSFAAGNYSVASAANTIAIGNQSHATYDGAIAFGELNTASGADAIVFGQGCNATNRLCTAFGSGTTASGRIATAMGNSSVASGEVSFALGLSTVASGDYSTALGDFVSTNLKEGAFIIGDHSTETLLTNTSDNQFAARFAGGYSLYTNANATVGVQVVPGGNAWSTISDKKRKENFAPVNGEEFLNKINKFDLMSWNYKGQDAKAFRHYGPMAQDFYNAFGKDAYGTIGNDTTINQADFEGINLIAIQALEKRTAELKKENEQLKQELSKVIVLEKENESLKQSVAQLQSSFAEQQKAVVACMKQVEELALKQSFKPIVASK